MAENKEMINKVYSSVFDLPVKVSIDYGNGKDVTASIIGFTNDEGKFIVLANFDDTTKIGKMIIDELEKMRTKSIKSAEPTNALEYLEHIKNNDFNMFIATYPPIPAYNGKAKDDMFDTIKQALTTKSKKELAFIYSSIVLFHAILST